MDLLRNKYEQREISYVQCCEKMSALTQTTLKQFADILSDKDYAAFFGSEKGKEISIIDMNQVRAIASK